MERTAQAEGEEGEEEGEEEGGGHEGEQEEALGAREVAGGGTASPLSLHCPERLSAMAGRVVTGNKGGEPGKKGWSGATRNGNGTGTSAVVE